MWDFASTKGRIHLGEILNQDIMPRFYDRRTWNLLGEIFCYVGIMDRGSCLQFFSATERVAVMTNFENIKLLVAW